MGKTRKRGWGGWGRRKMRTKTRRTWRDGGGGDKEEGEEEMDEE